MKIILRARAHLLLAAAILFSGCKAIPLPDPDPVIDATPAHRDRVEAFLEANYRKIPLIVDSNRLRFFVPITIDGRQGRLLVDSGAGISILYSGSLAKFGLKDTPKNSLPLVGVGGKIAAGWTPYRSFMIGDRIAVTPGDIRIVEHADSEECDGLLGNDLMRHLRVVVDFKNDSLLFLEPLHTLAQDLPDVANEAGMKTAVMRRVIDNAYIDVRISGYTRRFIVDSGAPGVLLTKETARETGCDWMSTAGRVKGVGGDGERMLIVRLPRRIVIDGAFTLERCFVIGADHGEDTPVSNYGGLLGATVLARNAAILDIGNNRIYFDSQKLTAPFPLPENSDAPPSSD